MHLCRLYSYLHDLDLSVVNTVGFPLTFTEQRAEQVLIIYIYVHDPTSTYHEKRQMV